MWDEQSKPDYAPVGVHVGGRGPGRTYPAHALPHLQVRDSHRLPVAPVQLCMAGQCSLRQAMVGDTTSCVTHTSLIRHSYVVV
jgi:hypothetical protein